MADQLVLGDPKAPRFVYWDKKLRPTPSGKPGFESLRVSDLWQPGQPLVPWLAVIACWDNRLRFPRLRMR